MTSESLVSDPVDPLHSQFGVSLFSRTIRVPAPSDPKDLEAIHQLMKSVKTLNSPEKVVEESKAIVDGGSKLLESAYPKFMESLGIEWDTFAHEGKENVQERRPGLGCKRARFTLKTNASTKPSASLESTLDFEQPCDAEAFFYAFEKAEEAKRELQRLNGGAVSDFNKHDQPTNTRSRRPGILGYRKSYSYKHRNSSANNDSHTFSEDTQELNLPGSPSFESQKGKANIDFEAQETNVAGSATETEEGYSDILDELFSKNSEDLDGDGAISFLEERLSIKPIGLGTFSIPGLDVGRTDFMAMGGKLPTARKTLTNISTLAKRFSGDTHAKQKRVGGSPISPITSPTPPSVALGSISLMKKRSSLHSPLRDPFSPLNIDLLEPRMAFSGDDIDKQPPQAPVRKELSCSGNLEPQVENELGRPTTDNVGLQTVVPRASDSPNDCFSDKSLEAQVEDESGRSTASDVDLQTLISGSLDSPDDLFMDNNLGQGTTDDDIWPKESQSDFTEHCTSDGLRENTTVEESINVAITPDKNTENVIDRCEAAVLPSQFNSHADDSKQTDSDTGVHQAHKVEGLPLKAAVPAVPEASVSQLQIEDSLSAHLLEGRPNTAATEDGHVDAPSITADIMTMKTSEKIKPKKVMTKRPRGESRELKALPRRKSLAEAGTYFESGVRRSKRIKTRPLEYWKGERLLYGRIDESIKLVGLKYISPSKGERNLKVKAYISDDYKEIIDLASRH